MSEDSLGRDMAYQDMGTVFSGFFRLGFVTDGNENKRIARVKFEDLRYTSDWIPAVKPYMPKKGEQVLCIYEPVRNGRGFILGGIQPWR